MEQLGRDGLTLVLLTTALCGADAVAANLSCYENPRTNQHWCFDESAVTEKQGIRTTSLYSGGPNGVRATNFFIATNCATGVTHLKDRDGVSFAGGTGNETDALKSLRIWMCAARIKGTKNTKPSPAK